MPPRWRTGGTFVVSAVGEAPYREEALCWLRDSAASSGPNPTDGADPAAERGSPPWCVTAGPGTSAAPLVQATLDAATTERTMLLTELYRRGPLWRLRTVGQGYDHGLATLARGYGVDIAD